MKEKLKAVIRFLFAVVLGVVNAVMLLSLAALMAGSVAMPIIAVLDLCGHLVYPIYLIWFIITACIYIALIIHVNLKAHKQSRKAHDKWEKETE